MNIPSSQVEALPDGRLDSWKEIAAYLGRNERTVRRWEQSEGLPVHRLMHDKKGSVYAYRGELDAWRISRKPTAGEGEEEAASAPLDSTQSAGPRRSRLAVWVGAAAFALLAAVAGWALARSRTKSPLATFSSIGVLPFENLSHDPAQELFSDGMTETPRPGRRRSSPGLRSCSTRVDASR